MRADPHRFVPPFYGDSGYLDARRRDHARRAARRRAARPVQLSRDPAAASAQGRPDAPALPELADCCAIPSAAHATCYRHQSIATTRRRGGPARTRPGKFSIAFQSRLGGGWLQPFTDVVLAELPARGVTRLAVVCPSFVADCLETLEEIEIRGRETFLAAGGASFTYLPCLNDDPRWIDALAALCDATAAHAR